MKKPLGQSKHVCVVVFLLSGDERRREVKSGGYVMEIKVEVTLVVQYPLNTQKKKNQAVRGSNTYNEPIPQSPHDADPILEVPRPFGQAEHFF